jgi:hypothetical protein
MKTYLIKVVDDTSDLLGVTFKDCHDLFRVFVEHGSTPIAATSQNLAGVATKNVQGQNARNTGTVDTLEYKIYYVSLVFKGGEF